MDHFEPDPEHRPPVPRSYFQSDHFSMLLGIAGSLFLVVGVWLWDAGYTFDATAAFILAALGILSGALTFRRQRSGPGT
jgi:hypothetical protein